MNEKTIQDWERNNFLYFDYYYNQYPFLKRDGIKLPVPYFTLKLFYVKDMRSRYFKPSQIFLDNYSYLLSYFFANYPISGTNKQFKSKPFFDLLLSNVIPQTTKTLSEIGNSLGGIFGNINVLLILGFTAIILYEIKK